MTRDATQAANAPAIAGRIRAGARVDSALARLGLDRFELAALALLWAI